jgi:ribonuclease HI
MELNIYCDGGARGNPGPAGIGITAEFSIFQPKADPPLADNFQFSNLPQVRNDGQLNISKYIGVKTNNQAEYLALIHALKWVADNLKNLEEKPKRINFFLDSTLVVNQANGKFKVKNSKLAELLLEVRNLEGRIDIPINYKAIPREQNSQADSLVNKALDKICCS